MSRYIDADALIRDLQERYCRPCKVAGLDYNEVRCRACQFDDEINDIDAFADNSIDIVRCKECRWRMEDKSCDLNCRNNYLDGTESDMWFYTEDDDFCSYGEREGE